MNDDVCRNVSMSSIQSRLPISQSLKIRLIIKMSFDTLHKWIENERSSCPNTFQIHEGLFWRGVGEEGWRLHGTFCAN